MNDFTLTLFNSENSEELYVSTAKDRLDELTAKMSTLTEEEYDELEELQMVTEEMKNGEAEPISSILNVPFELCDVMFTTAHVISDDGVVTDSIRTIVNYKSNEKKSVFATNSKIFAEKMLSILNIAGNPRYWRRPRKYVVKEVKTKNGHTYTILPYRG